MIGKDMNPSLHSLPSYDQIVNKLGFQVLVRAISLGEGKLSPQGSPTLLNFPLAPPAIMLLPNYIAPYPSLEQ